MTATNSAPTTDTWAAQLEQLKLRYKHIRPPILAALNILLHNKDIELDDAKAQATLHGVRITAASVAAAQRLLSRMGDQPAAATTATKRAPAAAERPARRPRAPARELDAEALVRGVVAKIQGQGTAEADRLRDAMRKAIAVLQAAVG